MQIQTIYLHIGFHKTGTSTIQETLFTNSKILEKNACLYPQSLGINHSVPIYSQFCDQPEKYHIFLRNNNNLEEINQFNSIIKNNFLVEINNNNKCSKLIISGEDIALLSENNLKKFHSFLIENIPHHKIKIIAWVREVGSFYSSMMGQEIKDGRNIEWCQKLITKSINNLYQGRLLKFMNIFGKDNMIVQAFEEASEHPQGILGFFLQSLEIAEDEIEKFSRERKSNVGGSDKAIDLINYINTKLPFFSSDRLNPGRFDGDTNLIHSLVKGNKFQIDVEDIANIRQVSQADILWLKQTFNIDYTQSSAFPPTKTCIYDREYYENIVTIFPQLSPVIKRLIYDYLCEKKAHNSHLISQNTFLSLTNFISNNYPEVLEKNYCDSIPLVEQTLHKQREKNALEHLKNALNIPADKPLAEIYRDIALFLEQHNQIESAAYCMKKALENRPTGPLINIKYQQYKHLLKSKLGKTN